MPLFSIDITKRFEGYEWHNDYVILASDVNVAYAAAHDLKDFERAIHFTEVEFIEVKASPIPNPNRNQHISTVIDEKGIRSVPRAEYGEARRVLYVKLNASLGMPGRKMYRYTVADSEYQGKGEGALITSAQFKATFSAAADVLFEKLSFGSVALLVNQDAREVSGFEISTVTSLQPRKSHYNRKPAATTAQQPESF